MTASALVPTTKNQYIVAAAQKSALRSSIELFSNFGAGKEEVILSGIGWAKLEVEGQKLCNFQFYKICPPSSYAPSLFHRAGILLNCDSIKLQILIKCRLYWRAEVDIQQLCYLITYSRGLLQELSVKNLQWLLLLIITSQAQHTAQSLKLLGIGCAHNVAKLFR